MRLTEAPSRSRGVNQSREFQASPRSPPAFPNPGSRGRLDVDQGASMRSSRSSFLRSWIVAPGCGRLVPHLRPFLSLVCDHECRTKFLQVPSLLRSQTKAAPAIKTLASYITFDLHSSARMQKGPCLQLRRRSMPRRNKIEPKGASLFRAKVLAVCIFFVLAKSTGGSGHQGDPGERKNRAEQKVVTG